MWGIYETLGKYHLDDLPKLGSNLTSLSDEQLIAFMEDIERVTETEENKPRIPTEGVNLCPIGGDLCLGNLQEISKQLLLYADHIVLEEPLTEISRHIIETGKLSHSREVFIQRFHPLIRQLLLIKPAVEQGIIHFVHDNSVSGERAFELASKIEHPQLERITHRLSGMTTCYRQPNGVLSFFFGKGSNFFMGIGGNIITRPRFPVRGDLPDTEKEKNAAFGDWQPQPGSKKVPGRFIENDWKSREAFSAAVNAVISRVILGMHVARSTESYYITDDIIEWEIIKLLSRIEGEQKQIKTASHVADAFSMQIAKELTFLDNVSIENILEVRTKYPDEFTCFRSNLLNLTQKVNEIDEWDSLNKLARTIVTKEISSAISNIKIVFENLKRERIRDVAIATSVASISFLASLYIPQITPWVGTISLGWLLKKENERRDKADRLRERPMYFLWQVMGKENR